tara:strand:+ start:909 stop:1208 length:300 start_codon:yes stop_codon:yes gene_type:complete
MKRYIIIVIALVFAFSSFSLAARSDKKITKSSKSSTQKLSKADIALIDKAIKNKFSNLSSKEKDRLIELLNDVKNDTDDKSTKSRSKNSKKSNSGGSNK